MASKLSDRETKLVNAALEARRYFCSDDEYDHSGEIDTLNKALAPYGYLPMLQRH